MAMDREKFLKFLGEGKYNSAGGARKAVGKAHGIEDKEKDELRKIIDAHFGAAPAKPAPKAAPKPEPKAIEKVQPVGHQVPASPQQTDFFSSAEKGSMDDLGTTTVQMRIAERVLSSTGQAVSAITEAHGHAEDVDISAALERASEVMVRAVGIFDGIVAKINHINSCKGGAELFEESMPKVD